MTSPPQTIPVAGGQSRSLRRSVEASLDRARAQSPWWWLMLAMGVVVLGAWLGLALVHVGDRYGLNSTSTVWMGLAEYASRGVLFPPIVDGDYFAGTRYMPLPVVAHALLAQLTGEYLVSGKVLGLLSMVILGTLLVIVLRRERVELAVALVIAAVVLASPVGVVATTALRPEAIPTALQLGAVALVAHSSGRKALILAAALAALALVAKLSSGYAAIAIIVWLLFRDRRGSAVFGLAFGSFLVAELFILDRITDGRMWTNLIELGANSASLADILSVPASFLSDLAVSPALYLALPVVAAWSVVVARQRAVSIYHVALLISVGITLVLYTDPGVWYNHLLDILVLVGILIGQAWAWARDSKPTQDLVRGSLVAALIFGSVTAVAAGPGIDLALAVRHVVTSPGVAMYGTHILDPYLADDPLMLADDAWIPLAYGQRPFILDAFMLERIGARDPATVSGLVERISRADFPHIVLQFDVNEPDAGLEVGPHALGPELEAAIRARYSLVDVVRTPSVSYSLLTPEFYVYAPR